MKSIPSDNKLLILAGLGAAGAYFLSFNIYQIQLVYKSVWESKVTLVWIMALFLWQAMSGKIAEKIGGNVKKNGWILYGIGVTGLVWYALS